MQKQYDLQLCMWQSMDKLAKSNFSISPYGYAGNNTGNNIDVPRLYAYAMPDPQIYIPITDNVNPYNIGK